MLSQQVERRDPDAEHEPEVAIVRDEDVACRARTPSRRRPGALRGLRCRARTESCPDGSVGSRGCRAAAAAACSGASRRAARRSSPPRSSAARAVTVFAIAHLFAERAADTPLAQGARPAARSRLEPLDWVPMPVPEAIPHAEMVRARRRLHASPELSMVEFDTARFVAETLGTYGLDEVRTQGRQDRRPRDAGRRPAGAGHAAARRHGRAADPRDQRRRLRLDARGRDARLRPRRTRRDPARGGARRWPSGAPRLPGTLVFCFQPGEEGAAGNRFMIEDGALENPHVDRTFALHLYSGLDVGQDRRPRRRVLRLGRRVRADDPRPRRPRCDAADTRSIRSSPAPTS